MREGVLSRRKLGGLPKLCYAFVLQPSLRKPVKRMPASQSLYLCITRLLNKTVELSELHIYTMRNMQ